MEHGREAELSSFANQKISCFCSVLGERRPELVELFRVDVYSGKLED